MDTSEKSLRDYYGVDSCTFIGMQATDIYVYKLLTTNNYTGVENPVVTSPEDWREDINSFFFARRGEDGMFYRDFSDPEVLTARLNQPIYGFMGDERSLVLDGGPNDRDLMLRGYSPEGTNVFSMLLDERQITELGKAMIEHALGAEVTLELRYSPEGQPSQTQGP